MISSLGIMPLSLKGLELAFISIIRGVISSIFRIASVELKPPLKLTQKIIFNISNFGNCTPVVQHIVNNTAYGVLFTSVGTPNEKWAVFAWNISNDKIIWAWTLGISPGGWLETAVTDGRIFFLEYSTLTSGIVRTLDASNGKSLWNQSLGKLMSGYKPPPVVSNGVVYVGGTEQGYLYAFNVENGSLLWKFPASVRYQFAVFNGIVYFADYLDKKLFAVTADTGKLKWSTGGRGPILAVDGTVYGVDDNGIKTLNASNGALLWNAGYSLFESNGPVSVELVNNVVYLAGGEAIVALNATNGKTIWSYSGRMGNVPSSFFSVKVFDGYVYSRSANPDNLLALKIDTGNLVWLYPIYRGISPLIVFNNKLYIMGTRCEYSEYGGQGSLGGEPMAGLLVFESSSSWWSDSYSRKSVVINKDIIAGNTRLWVSWSNAPITVMTNSTVARVLWNNGILTMEVYGIDGTTGSLNITVPKLFVPLASNISILLNGKAANFSYTQQGEWAVAQLIYKHSSETIDISYPTYIGSEAKSVVISLSQLSQSYFIFIVVIIVAVVVIASILVFRRNRASQKRNGLKMI